MLLWLTSSLTVGISAANTYTFPPVQTLTPAWATSVNQEGGGFDFSNWVNRGMTIRGGDSVYSCLANLTAALELVGQLNQAEYNGAAGALSLLPTAGALLEVLTPEMWILYKSVFISGAPGVLLSLGGSTTPSNVGDYDPNKPFSFGSFVLTIPAEAPRRPKSHATSDGYGGEYGTSNDHHGSAAEANIQKFAQEIKQRAQDDGGGSMFLRIWFAIRLQI